MHRRGAFTYIELMIVVVVAAILTMVAIADSESAVSAQGLSAAEQLTADVAFARSLAISDPDSMDPVIIKIDVDDNRYWIARKQTEDTPITHPKTGEPYIVSFGEDGDPGFDRVQIVGSDFDGSVILEFDSFGGTTQSAEGILQLKSGDAEYEVSVTAGAGDAGIVEGFTKSLDVLEGGLPEGAGGGTLPAAGGGATPKTPVGGTLK